MRRNQDRSVNMHLLLSRPRYSCRLSSARNHNQMTLLRFSGYTSIMTPLYTMARALLYQDSRGPWLGEHGSDGGLKAYNAQHGRGGARSDRSRLVDHRTSHHRHAAG